MINFNEILDYDKNTGTFVWKVNCSRQPKGSFAGSVNQGYVRIKINGRSYAAHRLAWFMSFGYWPKNEIDHINRIRSDNRLCNLREVTRSQNSINVAIRNNLCGYKGVFRKPHGRYQARIVANGQKHYLGHYDTPEEAHEAYLQAAPLYHGNFANLTTANHKEILMSRKPSVVLSPAEKKAALKEAKEVLKAAIAATKALVAESKVVAKARAAEDKDFNKRVTATEKAQALAQAGVDALVA